MAYQRVNWQNRPSTDTPVNATSLNIMDEGIFDNSQDIEQNTQDIQENRNILNGLASAGCLYVEDIQCRNLFNKNAITEGVCLNGDGTTREASNFCISDYIPVKMLKKYTYQGLTNVGNETYSEFYSSNKTFISSFQQQTAINTITIPIGAAYVRFSIRTSSSDQNTFQIEPGEVATNYTEHKEITPTIENSLDSDSTENVPSVHAVKEQIDSLNVYSENEVIVGSWFGKTLYRKVLHTTLPTTPDGVNTPKDIDISSLNKEIIKIPEALVITEQQQFLPIYYANNAGNSVKTFVLGDVLRIYNAVASYSEADCYITLEYTKTTNN